MGLWIALGVVGGILLLALITLLICFFRVFYAPKRKVLKADEYEYPDGEIYVPYHGAMREWTKKIREMPHEDVCITSFDGLTLRGTYYEYEKGAPVELLFHGYQGNAERDLSGGVFRCFAVGRNALIINQRASGPSDGHVITFGINERKDCLRWIDFAVEKFGKDVKLILTGISMGAATVMMTAGEKLPENVVCVLADCGYSSPKEIICKIVREMHLPVKLMYPFIKWSAKLFGGFNLEETSPLQAMQTCQTPVIFIHGDNDLFVPWEMSKAVYDACPTQKKLVLIKGGGHGIAYVQDKEGYLSALREFAMECGFQQF